MALPRATEAGMNKPTVMYILRQYPQISETYIQTEMDAVSDEFEVIVIALQDAAKNGNTGYANHLPYLVINDLGQIANAIKMFKPQVLHTHWLISLPLIVDIARAMHIPFTVRAHSFDTIVSDQPRLAEWREMAAQVITDASHDELCLGILAFPFSLAFLHTHGAQMDKVTPCFPCVDYQRFHDRTANGEAIMNVGACIPKKRMEDFLEIGASLPGHQCNLYAVSYRVEQLAQKNIAMGSPINIQTPIEPALMPAEYKKHRWLLYTADWHMGSIGWPLSIAEAQAAGVGVLLPGVRPDIADYLNGSGYIYHAIDEAREIVSGALPDEMREAGFENARKSDVREHKSLLTDMWRQVTG